MEKIIPAILTNKPSDLKSKLEKISHLTNGVQIDIMDGKFVKNTSVNLADLRKVKLPKNLEIHLMVENPEKYFKDCQKIKAKRVIFHFEATKKPSEVLGAMGRYDFEKGLALNPETSIEKVKAFLDKLDLVLLLAVNPGFQSQKFNPIVLEKIPELRKISKRIKIGIDGGINSSNLQSLAKCKANYFVVGSYLFKSKNLKRTFSFLKSKVESK